ncbi:hypothetical protein [Effusibacillus dendaii]|nr:hypothetical protein [Effusibacillus dendaii]
MTRIIGKDSSLVREIYSDQALLKKLFVYQTTAHSEIVKIDREIVGYMQVPIIQNNQQVGVLEAGKYWNPSIVTSVCCSLFNCALLRELLPYQ